MMINNGILIVLIILNFYNGKSGQVNFCLGELILKLLTRIGE